MFNVTGFGAEGTNGNPKTDRGILSQTFRGRGHLSKRRKLESFQINRRYCNHTIYPLLHPSQILRSSTSTIMFLLPWFVANSLYTSNVPPISHQELFPICLLSYLHKQWSSMGLCLCFQSFVFTIITRSCPLLINTTPSPLPMLLNIITTICG